MTRKSEAEPLFDVPNAPPARGGALYQAVSKQIRTLESDGTIDKDRHAGLSGQARAIAASIDHAGGRNDRGHVASGMQLAALHAQLLAVLQAMAPAAPASGDAFDAWLRDGLEMPALETPPADVVDL